MLYCCNLAQGYFRELAGISKLILAFFTGMMVYRIISITENYAVFICINTLSFKQTWFIMENS